VGGIAVQALSAVLLIFGPNGFWFCYIYNCYNNSALHNILKFVVEETAYRTVYLGVFKY
jgi:hypothetical protein